MLHKVRNEDDYCGGHRRKILACNHEEERLKAQGTSRIKESRSGGKPTEQKKIRRGPRMRISLVFSVFIFGKQAKTWMDAAHAEAHLRGYVRVLLSTNV